MASPETAVAPGEAPITYTERPVLCPPTPELARGQLHLRTLGAAEVHVGEGAIIGPSSERLFSMLVVCALEPDHVISRTQLLALVWPDMDDAAARHSLRQHTYRLRKMGIGIDSTRAAVVLDRASILPSFAVDRTSALFQRDVLHGQEPFGHLCAGWVPTLSTLRQWLERQRELYHAEVRRVLVPELRMLRDRGQWEDCERWSRTVLEFDSFNEDATLILAEAIAMLGSRARATELLESYVRETGSAGTPLGRRVEQAQQRIMRAGRVSYDGSARTKLVGRNDELARLDALTQQAMQGHAQMVRITGPAGIGKTELSYEATRRAVILGFGRCLVRVSRTMGQVAHGTLSRMVRDLLNLPGSLGCRPANLRLLRQFAGVEPTSNWELSDELSTPSPLTECLLELITSIAEERPLFILVDDLHYVDRQSLEEIERLFDLLQRQQVVFVVTERGVDEATIRTDVSDSRTTELWLRPLTHRDGVELASIIQSPSGRRLRAEAAKGVAAASDHSPLQIITFAREALTQGLTDFDPPVLRHALRRQILRLSVQARTVLQSIAIVGGKAPTLEICSAIELDFVRRLAAVTELLQSGLAEETADQHIQAHDVVSAAALENLSDSELRMLQRQLARASCEILRKQFVSDRAVSALELALSSGDRQLFVDNCLAFAERIADDGLVAGALRLLELAVRSCGSEADHARLLLLLARTANRAANWRLAISSAVEFRRVQGDSASKDIELALAELEANLKSKLLLRGRDDAHHALEIAKDPTRSLTHRIRGVRLVISSASDLFESDLAISAFEVLRGLQQNSLLDVDPWIEPYLQYHTVFGDLSTAYQTAIKICAESGEKLKTPFFARMYCNACFTLRLTGHAKLATKLLESAFFSDSLRENPGRRIFAAWQLSLIACEAGNSRSAAQWHSRLEEIASRELNVGEESWYVLHRFRMELTTTGRFSSPLFIVRQFESASKVPSRALLYATALSLCALRDGNDDARNELLVRATRYLEEFGRFGGQDMLAYGVLGALDGEPNQAAAARAIARRYVLEDRREGFSPVAGMPELSEALSKELHELYELRTLRANHVSDASSPGLHQPPNLIS